MKIKSIEFFNKILFELKKGPKTISQIATNIGTNWDSTKNHIKELEELDFLIKYEKNNKEYYQINPNPTSKKDFGTYFNLPIDEKTKNLFETYYYLIKKEWEKITNKKPTITQIYKVLAKLNYDDKLKLNLPIGWYNFGQMPILIYKEENCTEEKEYVSKEIKIELSSIIKKYSEYPTIKKLKQEQYKEFKKNSYILKEKILENLYYNKKDNFVNKELLINNLKNFIKSLINDKIKEEFIDFIEDFYLLILHFNDISKNSKEDEFRDYREILIESFNELFKLIAINYYQISLKDFYSNDILNISFEKEIKIQKQIVKEKFFEIIEIIEEKVDKIYNNFNFNNTKIKREDYRGNDNELISVEEQKKEMEDLF